MFDMFSWLYIIDLETLRKYITDRLISAVQPTCLKDRGTLFRAAGCVVEY